MKTDIVGTPKGIGKEALHIGSVMPSADLKFILIHKENGTEIEMPVLSICEEYSKMSFGTKNGDYNDDYKGIMRLQDTSNDTAENYYVYVDINGIRHLYDGLFYNSDYTETKRKH
jgi:hypothetical protein